MSGTATKNQLNFIKKLREASQEREEKLQEFLKSKGKADPGELDVPEASELIDSLKNVKVAGEAVSENYATGKQINCLSNLQDSDERREATAAFLSGHGKESINHLSMSEASELIEKLMQLRGGDSSERAVSQATSKQIKFIQNLQKSDEQIGKANDYLKKVKKGSLDELTRKEASELIELLKG